jgi:hypothetical protein
VIFQYCDGDYGIEMAHGSWTLGRLYVLRSLVRIFRRRKEDDRIVKKRLGSIASSGRREM